MAIRQRLLETPAERVSPELAKTVADFCEPIDVIASAYVGLIEITRGIRPPGGAPRSRVRAGRAAGRDQGGRPRAAPRRRPLLRLDARGRPRGRVQLPRAGRRRRVGRAGPAGLLARLASIEPMLDPGAFKAYDVRALYPSQLDEEGAYAVGRAFAEQFEPRRIAIGRDMRLSSPSMAEAVINGVADAGIDVADLGMVGTEMVYFATGELGLDGGIMVTASHNPADYTGMKIVRRGALPVGSESGLVEIRDRAVRGEWRDAPARGTVEPVDVWDGLRRAGARLRRRRCDRAASDRRRRRERDGRRDAAAGARAAAAGRGRALQLRAGRVVPEPRAEPAAAREPRVHRAAHDRGGRGVRRRLRRRRRPVLLRRRHAASSCRATSRPRCSPSRCSRGSRAGR